ncbi:unnamed protein product [Arctogadus glacialis]
MKSDSPAFRAVKDVVLGNNLLRDLQQMALFKHTGMLKSAPKRLHFSYDTMLARTHLTLMDHKANVGRPQAKTEVRTGTPKNPRTPRVVFFDLLRWLFSDSPTPFILFLQLFLRVFWLI